MFTPVLRTVVVALFVALSWCAASSAEACTGIRLKADDGSVVYARTLEFGTDLHSAVLVIPRHYLFTGTTSSSKPGLEWQSKYAVVGLDGEGLVAVADGVNEHGLAGGMFYMPSYAGYQHVTPEDASRSLAPWQVVTWALTMFQSVEELREALPTIKVAAVEFDAWNFVPPLHYVFHDAQGNSLVVEYIDGELKLYEDPIGVVTNSPGFDWHVTNLRNYVNLTAVNVPPLSLDGIKLGQLGQGSGMLGMPGDFTPPSRFVRAAALSQTALAGQDGPQAVRQAFHILDSFDIPLGSVRDVEKDTTNYEYTQWTSASDTKNRTFYCHTQGNRRIRRFDLLKADLDATQLVRIELVDREDFDDLNSHPVAK